MAETGTAIANKPVWVDLSSGEADDTSFTMATEAGAQQMLAPMDFPGGRFGILRDPQGAAFGLLRMRQP